MPRPEQKTDPRYLRGAEFIDADHLAIRAYAAEHAGPGTDPAERAIALYYAVRDDITYDPYYVGRAPRYFRASDCLAAGRGFCIPKAALLAAAARALGIPARVGFADVRNHLSTPKLTELVGGDVYAWHSYTELHLRGRWVKATPAFNLELCQRFGVHALEFDGRADSLLQEYDTGGRRHMEYLRERGHFPDVPYAEIIDCFEREHPRWLHNRQQPPHDRFSPDPS